MKNSGHKTIRIPQKTLTVDVGIAPVVKWLNSYPAIFTLYSCQGDPGDEDRDSAYAGFICRSDNELDHVRLILGTFKGEVLLSFSQEKWGENIQATSFWIFIPTGQLKSFCKHIKRPQQAGKFMPLIRKQPAVFKTADVFMDQYKCLCLPIKQMGLKVKRTKDNMVIMGPKLRPYISVRPDTRSLLVNKHGLTDDEAFEVFEQLSARYPRKGNWYHSDPIFVAGRLILANRFSGRAIHGRPKSEYLTAIFAFDEESLAVETEKQIWDSIRALEDPQDDSHWQNDACRCEWDRRGNSEMYEHLYAKAFAGKFESIALKRSKRTVPKHCPGTAFRS